MSKTLTVIAEFVAVSGRRPELDRALDAMVGPSLAEAGCLRYQPWLHPTDADRMAIIEQWADEDALQTHFGTAHFAHVVRQLEELLAEPFTLTRLTEADG
jgi:quinol monooxygenase YgiN